MQPLIVRLKILEQRLDAAKFAEDARFNVLMPLRDIRHIIAAVEFMEQRCAETLSGVKKTPQWWFRRLFRR
jgi:hypothetical protein